MQLSTLLMIQVLKQTKMFYKRIHSQDYDNDIGSDVNVTVDYELFIQLHKQRIPCPHQQLSMLYVWFIFSYNLASVSR